jgi:DNA repair protein SbcD/Mre11
MKLDVLHLSDIHYCSRHLHWVDKAMIAATEVARAQSPACIVISGDTFDAAVQAHEQAYQLAVDRIAALLNIAPVLVLQGTFSHDRPGVLSPLRHLRGRHPIYVAEDIKQVALQQLEDSSYRWRESTSWTFDALPGLATAIFSCLPSQNRAQFRIAQPDGSIMESIGDLMLGWSGIHKVARAAGVPSIVVSHGTVNGCSSESKHAMISPDHEFSTGTLFSADASAVLLGHIHLHQHWRDGRSVIAYPGSLARLVYGHEGPTGALRWSVDADGADFEQVVLPSRALIDLDFPGPPDMARVAEAARDCRGAYVRLRYTLDEEHRHAVDANQLRELLEAGGSEEVRIEARINPVQRTRASGIHETQSVADKVKRYCELSQIEPEPLLSRLAILESGQQPGAA